MKHIFYIFFAGAISGYIGMNYYIGLRGWQAFDILFPEGFRRIYWAILWIISFSYPLGRFGKRFLNYSLSNKINKLGSYWLGAVVYFFIFVLLTDLIRIINLRTGIFYIKPGQKPLAELFAGGTVVFFTFVLMVYGFLNARKPKISYYEIKINKRAGCFKKLNIVMVSDVHLGIIMDYKRLNMMVNKINELKPDIVLLPGDFIDENIQPFIDQKMTYIVQQISTNSGIYATFGNHEYYGGYEEEIHEHLQNSGIRVLRDEAVKIKDSFYIIGREDETYERFKNKPRKELNELLKEIDTSLPIILLQHQPKNISEHKIKGIDLQLSGHTHGGQFFPFNFATKKIYEIDFGLLKTGDFHIIVSSGFGTWGPPIRVGNKPEIVHINVHFL